MAKRKKHWFDDSDCFTEERKKEMRQESKDYDKGQLRQRNAFKVRYKRFENDKECSNFVFELLKSGEVESINITTIRYEIEFMNEFYMVSYVKQDY